MDSSFYQFVAYIVFLFYSRFAFEERREEKKFQDKEHDEKFDENHGPQRTSQRHAAETVAVKSPNTDDSLSDHNGCISVIRQR